MPGIQELYRKVISTEFKEIRFREDLTADPALTAWILNPAQHFVVNASVLDLFPSLSVIVTPSTGRNHIDRGACSNRKVAVYSLLDDRKALERISASAEYTFFLILNTLRRMDLAKCEVSARRWRQYEDRLRGHELQGKKVGLVGLGRIGRRLARYCSAFDAQVVGHDPYVQNASIPNIPLEELFSTSDIVCLCCELNSETHHMIRRKHLKSLKKGASLVNTSRGEVIEENDLLEVIRERPDLRINLDVISGQAQNRHQTSQLLSLHDAKQIEVTPHIAGVTLESQSQAASIALNLLENYFKCLKSTTLPIDLESKN